MDMTGQRITVWGRDLKDGARHTHWDGRKERKKKRKIASVDKELENLKLSCSASGNVRWHSCVENGK